MNTILAVENLYYSAEKGDLFSHAGEKKLILKNINFMLEKGSILGIAGESGSGKTTLAKIIAGVIKPARGRIEFSKELKKKKSHAGCVQILFQNNGEILNPLREIEKMIDEALLIANDNYKEIISERESIFNSVGFPEELRKKKGYQLSGGEQQRAALARLLAVKPEILILDEPFSAQDPESQLNLLNLFKRINEEMGMTLICIAHNLRLLNKLCKNIIIMYKGEIVESGKTGEIFSSPQHPYTKFLIKAGDYNLSAREIFAKSKSFSGASAGTENDKD